MAHVSDLIGKDILAYLKSHEQKDLLRFITCGSVDDGKSTLIGRLLYESKMIFEDQLAALEADSKKVGTTGGDLDLALLVDGLAAEREQGITIDVAYRYFSTDKRKFIVADTPGHEQYTRNMVTGASTADLAIILIDARKGILVQSKRHSFLVSLIGIKRVVLAINKMDLVGFDQKTFDQILADYKTFAKDLGFTDITAIPMSALKGDNVVDPSDAMPWYKGPTLMGHLENVPLDTADTGPFRLPVQWVSRPNLDFRGFAGTIAGGAVRVGDTIRALPSGKSSKVTRIVTYDGDLEQAQTHQSVTLTLADEIDISRGDVLAASDNPAEIASEFVATLVWMSETPMLPRRSYLLKLGTKTLPATLAAPQARIDVNTLAREPAATLNLNEIGEVVVSLDQAIAFDPYTKNHSTGGFILIDRITNETLAAGMVKSANRVATNIHWQKVEVNKGLRASLKGQKPCVLWLTGLSGAGKSTIANLVERKLASRGRHTYLLDGDNVRHGLNRDLGFTDADREENIRRVAEVAKLMTDAGLIVLVSFISPFKQDRALAKALLPAGEFLEVHVDASLELAEQRDPKGLYKKARAGEIKNFTGLDSPYEAPDAPDIYLDTSVLSPEAAADAIIARLPSADESDFAL